MELGFVGLGRMGGNMVTRLVRGGHRVVAYDRAAGAAAAAKASGAEVVGSLEELPRALQPPRAVWIMVPAGDPTEATIQTLAAVLARDDIIVDGGTRGGKTTCGAAASWRPAACTTSMPAPAAASGDCKTVIA